jgi:hypothetical protein
VPATGKPVTGSFAISAMQNGTLNLTDAAGSSTFNIYMVDPALNILDPNSTSGGGGALLLHTDASINGTGIVVPQSVSATPSFFANYGLNLTNSIATATATDEFDLAGVVSSDGSSKFLNGLSIETILGTWLSSRSRALPPLARSSRILPIQVASQGPSRSLRERILSFRLQPSTCLSTRRAPLKHLSSRPTPRGTARGTCFNSYFPSCLQA